MLVGRVQELAALDAALERREGVVAIVGEPGIGKSRLLAAARAAGAARRAAAAPARDR
ncbi:MAG TPA: AAA family ATPase [Solirubrobacter sp.]|nr:AAA family ATPase [Solirubrobacter sp.]